MALSSRRPSALLAVALLLLCGLRQGYTLEQATNEPIDIISTDIPAVTNEINLSLDKNDTKRTNTTDEQPLDWSTRGGDLPAETVLTDAPAVIGVPILNENVVNLTAAVTEGENNVTHTPRPEMLEQEVVTVQPTVDEPEAENQDEEQSVFQTEASHDSINASADVSMAVAGNTSDVDTVPVIPGSLSVGVTEVASSNDEMTRTEEGADVDEGEDALEEMTPVATEPATDSEVLVGAANVTAAEEDGEGEVPLAAEWTGAMDVSPTVEPTPQAMGGEVDNEEEDRDAIILPVMIDAAAEEDLLVDVEEAEGSLESTESPVIAEENSVEANTTAVAVVDSVNATEVGLSGEVTNEESVDAEQVEVAATDEEQTAEVVAAADSNITTTPVSNVPMVESEKLTAAASPDVVDFATPMSSGDIGELEEQEGGMEGGAPVEEVTEGGVEVAEGEVSNATDLTGMDASLAAAGNGTTEGAIREENNVEEGMTDPEEGAFQEEETNAPTPEGLVVAMGEGTPSVGQNRLEVPLETEGSDERAAESGPVGAVEEEEEILAAGGGTDFVVTVEGVVQAEVEGEGLPAAISTTPPSRLAMEERSTAVVRVGEAAKTPAWYPSFLTTEADRHSICRGREPPSCCADGELSCECAPAAKCVVASGDPCGHHTSASSCEDSEDGSCAWSALHGVCRDASNVCNTLDGEPLQCATTPGCLTEPVCAPACTTCSACLNIALRFAEISRLTSSDDLGPTFTRFCRRQSGHSVDCDAAGRLLDAEPELVGRQLALCSAVDACNPACSASAAEVLESLGAADAIFDAGSALCLDAWSWDSEAVTEALPATAASSIAVGPVSAAGFATDGPTALGCVSAWDCDAGFECAPIACENSLTCDVRSGRSAEARCPLQCARPDAIECDEVEPLNNSICDSDLDCDDGLTCTEVTACQRYACDDSGLVSVDGTCFSRCLEPPTFLHASFSDNADRRTVELLLSHPALPLTEAHCDALFDEPTLAQLGIAPRCSVRDDLLTVSLGIGGTLSESPEAAELAFSESQTVLRSALAADAALFAGAIVGIAVPFPNRTPAPLTASLIGPHMMPEGGHCSDNGVAGAVVLDASQSALHGADVVEVVWTLTAFPEGLNISALLSRVADASNKMLLIIDTKTVSAMLPGDYAFTVSLVDTRNGTSTATHILQIAPRGALVLPEVNLPSRLEFDPESGLRLGAELELSFACGVFDSIHFEWKDESLDDGSDPLSAFWGAGGRGLRRNSPELFIPASLLSSVRSGDARRLSLIITAATNVTSRSTVEVVPLRKSAPIILSGPSGDIGVGAAVEFRAMALLDGHLVPAAQLPAVAPVRYTCRHLPDGAPCMDSNGRQPLQSGYDFVLPTGLVAANQSYEVCLEESPESLPKWLACKTITAHSEGSAPLGGIDPVCDEWPETACIEPHPISEPLRLQAWLALDDTALQWWSPQVQLLPGENCNANDHSRLTLFAEALPKSGSFEVRLNMTRGGVTAVSTAHFAIDAAPSCTIEECLTLTVDGDRVLASAVGWVDPEGGPLTYEFGEVARNGAAKLPHAPPARSPFRSLTAPLAAQSPDLVAHTFYVCVIDGAGGRTCVSKATPVPGSQLSTQDTVAAAFDRAFETSHVSPVPLYVAAAQAEATRATVTSARVARAMSILSDAAGVAADGVSKSPASFQVLSQSVRSASALLSTNELPCGRVSKRVVGLGSEFSQSARCLTPASLQDGLALMSGVSASAARPECRQPITDAKVPRPQVFTLANVLDQQVPQLAAAALRCASEGDSPVSASATVAGGGTSRMLSGVYRPEDLVVSGIEMAVEEEGGRWASGAARRRRSRRSLSEEATREAASLRVSFPDSLPLACAGDPSCVDALPVAVIHSESVAALMEVVSGGRWRARSGAVWVGAEGALGGNVTVRIPLYLGSPDANVTCVALSPATGQFVKIDTLDVSGSYATCSAIPGSGAMMVASRAGQPATGEREGEGDEAAFRVPDSPTAQDDLRTSIQNLTEKWEGMPLWQKIVIPVSLVILLLLCCACGVGIFCMCCKRRSSRAAQGGKKPKDVYQFSVSSAPTAAVQKNGKDRSQAISNPVFDTPGMGDTTSTGRRRSAGLNSTFDSEATLSPARTSVSGSPDRTQNAAGFGTRTGTRRPATTTSPIRRISGSGAQVSPGRASGSKSRPTYAGGRASKAKGHITWSSSNAENV